MKAFQKGDLSSRKCKCASGRTG